MRVRSPFRYPGGKSKVADLLLKYMPSGTLEYREPFVGGGGVFFGLAPNRVQRRWINDLNTPLVSVYRAFKDRPDEFIKLCRTVAPHGVGEEEVSTKGTGKKYNKRLGELFESYKYNEEMDQALRYFFINRTVWAGRVNYDRAFESRLYYSNPNGWNVTTRPGFLEAVAAHVAGTVISSTDYSVLLDSSSSEGLPSTESPSTVWVYLDPPYVVDTKLASKSKLYECGFTWDDHKLFVDRCKATKYRICISYDDVPEVREWFQAADGFHVYEHTWTYSGTSQSEKTVGKELVITNYPRPEAQFQAILP